MIKQGKYKQETEWNSGNVKKCKENNETNMAILKRKES